MIYVIRSDEEHSDIKWEYKSQALSSGLSRLSFYKTPLCSFLYRSDSNPYLFSCLQESSASRGSIPTLFNDVIRQNPGIKLSCEFIKGRSGC